MKLQKIMPDEVVHIHDRIVEASGGRKGIRVASLLDSLCITPFGNYFGQEPYPDVFLKATVILNSLVNYYVSVDGNKRCGLAVMEYFLFKNGYAFTNSKKIKENCVLQVATTKPNLADIATWIKSHAERLV